MSFNCFIFSFTSCRTDGIEPLEKECSVQVSYANNIRPVVLSHCATSRCHVAGFLPGDFTSYQSLKSKAENGRLRLFVLELRNMPPDSSLTQEQRQMIGCWIEQGAQNN